MEKELSLNVNPALLAKNPKAIAVLEELEAKGFLKNGKVVYDEEQESEVFDIINKIADMDSCVGNND